MTQPAGWSAIQEHPHLAIMAVIVAIYLVSLWRRKCSPSKDELWALGKAVMSTSASLLVIVWLAYQKNSDLSGLSVFLMFGALFHAFDSFAALTNSVRALWSKPPQPLPPESPPQV